MKFQKKCIIIFIFLSFLCACGDSSQFTPVINTPINLIIDLNNLPYQNLQFNNGWVYANGGLRGLIIYRKNATTYYAYDRACSYNIQNSCEKVEVDGSSFFLFDPCCKSRFDWEGQPMSGVARANLVRYQTSLSGSLLYINN